MWLAMVQTEGGGGGELPYPTLRSVACYGADRGWRNCPTLRGVAVYGAGRRGNYPTIRSVAVYGADRGGRGGGNCPTIRSVAVYGADRGGTALPYVVWLSMVQTEWGGGGGGTALSYVVWPAMVQTEGGGGGLPYPTLRSVAVYGADRVWGGGGNCPTLRGVACYGADRSRELPNSTLLTFTTSGVACYGADRDGGGRGAGGGGELPWYRRLNCVLGSQSEQTVTRRSLRTASFYGCCCRWLVACLTSQQHASVSQGRVCSDHCTCCRAEREIADPTCYLTQSQNTDTGLISPIADPTLPVGVATWNTNIEVTGMSRPLTNPTAKAGLEPRCAALEADAFTSRPTKRSFDGEADSTSSLPPRVMVQHLNAAVTSYRSHRLLTRYH